MTSQRIVNITNGCRYKRGRVQRLFDECAVGWVIEGVSIRNLTPDESRAARMLPTIQVEPEPYVFPYAELSGLRFDPPVSGIAAMRAEGRLMWEAHNFVMGATA